MSNVTSATLLGNQVTSYESLKQTGNSRSGAEMGKSDFLTLFTAQLKNQDPLDPVKNEAFVAQLAQFSSLEALTNMQTSLDGFVKSMSTNQMTNGVALIGKRVAATDTLTPMEKGGRIDASIDLPQGASGITLTIKDNQGRTVQELVAGAQNPGTTQLSWDGLDAMGTQAPTGSYRLVANAVINGQNTQVPVQTMVPIVAANSKADGTVSLQLSGGKTVLLKDVQKVGL